MTGSDDAQSLGEGRARYFADNGIAPDGGYADDWVHLKIGPVPVRFPNTAGRVRAVRFHDLNHVVTGYGTDLTGEAEIGAWEIASGCMRFPAAVVLNLLVMGPILFVAPGRIWRAFLRGRRSQNFYQGVWDDALLEREVGEARRALGLLAGSSQPSWEDRVRFVLLVACVLALQLAIASVLLGLPVVALRALLG